MVGTVRARQADVVLAYSLSRITRRVAEFLDLIELHRESGVLFKTCVSGDPDLSAADGRASAITVATWDQAVAERTAERVRRAARQRAEAGHYTGRRPFGYQFAMDDAGRVLSGRHRTLVIDEIEASIIRECVRRVLAGESLWAITKDLNARGATTSTGAPWQTQTMRRMLLRWTHAGYRKHQEYRNRKWVGQQQIHEAAWEPIIDRETHERVIAKLTDPSRITNKGDTELKYLLTWIDMCGACGRPMVGVKGYIYTVKGYRRADGTQSPSRELHYHAKYTCAHQGCHGITRRMDVVDEFVERHIVALLEAEGIQVLGGDHAVVDEAQQRIEEIKAKKALLSDLVMTPASEGGMDEEQFRRQNARLSAQLEAEQARLRSARPADGFEEFTGDSAASAWANAPIENKRLVLRALIEMAGLKITVDKVGPGAFSAAGANPYMGIRVEWDEASD